MGVTNIERRTDAVVAVMLETGPALANQVGCDGSEPLTEGPRDGCTWTVPNTRGTVVLIGDSNAAQFGEPLVEAGRRAGYDVMIVAHNACPS